MTYPRRFDRDAVRRDDAGPVVLVGGTGVVGRALQAVLAARDPALPVRITSRRPSADGMIALDLSAPAPLELSARAVMGLVNDPADRLLRACVAGGVPFVDITRYTPLLRATLAWLGSAAVAAPVVLASGWMGGVVPLLSRALADRLGGAARLETSILYDLNDQAGRDSVAFLDQMHVPFDIQIDGRARRTKPLTCAGRVELGGKKRGMLHLDTPEQHTLPDKLGAATVVTRIGFSSELATCGLHTLGKVGFFRAFRSPRFEGMRRGLLYSNGKGGVARLRVEAEGPAGREAIEVVDPAGQAHLTAVGASIALGIALGKAGPTAPGVVFPEQIGDAGRAIAELRARGVDVRWASEERGAVAA